MSLGRVQVQSWSHIQVVFLELGSGELDDCVESCFNSVSGLGASFEELAFLAEFVRARFASFSIYLPLAVFVGLVSNQNEWETLRVFDSRLLQKLLLPVFDIFVALKVRRISQVYFFVRDVVDDHTAIAFPVKRSVHRLELFLSSGIPKLAVVVLPIEGILLGQEISCQRRYSILLEFSVDISADETSLADASKLGGLRLTTQAHQSPQSSRCSTSLVCNYFLLPGKSELNQKRF